MNLKTINKITNFIKNYLLSAKANGVVVGMSGGKDSLITACLCAKAIGKENVLGLIMPNKKMSDIEIAKKSCEILGIRYHVIDIRNEFDNIINNTNTILKDENKKISDISIINTAPRLRMIYLYSVAGSLNYLVANTSNLSEKMIGYTTKWGDNVGDFSPLASFTKEEVCAIGLMLNLPKELVIKTPDDGLSGKSDEENIGFSYEELDLFIRTGQQGKNFAKIKKMHDISGHKRKEITMFKYRKKNYFMEKQK